MGAVKKPTFKYLATPRPLTVLSYFWQSFFERVTLEFNKEIFAALKANHSVTFTNREIIHAKDYKYNLTESVNLFFSVMPMGGLGFISIPQDFANYIVEQGLGGGKRKKGHDIKHQLTRLDHELVLRFMLKLTRGLLNTMASGPEMDIHILEVQDASLLSHQLGDEEFISVQQFTVTGEQRPFHFDLVFKQSTLK